MAGMPFFAAGAALQTYRPDQQGRPRDGGGVYGHPHLEGSAVVLGASAPRAMVLIGLIIILCAPAIGAMEAFAP